MNVIKNGVKEQLSYMTFNNLNIYIYIYIYIYGCGHNVGTIWVEHEP